MKQAILFVGSDWGRVDAAGFGREAEAQDWARTFVSSGLEALHRLSQESFDVVVADQDLPDLQGRPLLDEVARRQPRALRFLHSRLMPGLLRTQCVGAAHQLLARPCSAQTLASALRRAFSFQAWLPWESVHQLLPGLTKMPSPPETYFAVVKELQSPYASAERVGGLIARDPMMTAKLLQLANSAAFGLQQEVTSPVAAVMYLGLETTRSLILLAHAFSYFDELPLAGFSLERLWQHSLAVGQMARRVAEAEGVPDDVAGSAYTAGLLHDLGKLVLAANLPGPFAEAHKRAAGTGSPVWEAERQVLGVSHAEIGAALLGVWGLPAQILEAVAQHHRPARIVEQGFCPLLAVHVANVFAHEALPGSDGDRGVVDLDYLAGLGQAVNLERWRSLCLEEIVADG